MPPRASSRDRVARHRAARREHGLRPVLLWLPDLADPAYRARLARECRRLSRLTQEEAAMAAALVALARRTEAWR